MAESLIPRADEIAVSSERVWDSVVCPLYLHTIANMKMLLFDVDLTLVNTGGAGIRALNQATEEVLGFPEAMAAITPHGKTDPAIVREIITQNNQKSIKDLQHVTADILDKYLIYLEREVLDSDGYRVLPGIGRLLEEFSAREDVRLGLATGNLERGALIKLERGGLNAYFGFGGFGSDAADRRELVLHAARRGNDNSDVDVAGADTYVIGDTPKDIDAGKQAGFQTVGVATGSFSLEALQATGADVVIEDFVVGRDQFLRSTRTA